MFLLIFALYMATGYTTSSWADKNEELRIQKEQAIAKCRNASLALEAYIEKLDRTCKNNSDCEARYISADGCAPAILFPKQLKIDEKKLLRYQQEVRLGCESLWANRPVCSPLPVTPACHNGICIDNSLIPKPPKSKLDTARFNRPVKYGIVRSTCAPHDGPALVVTLSPDRLTCSTEISSKKAIIIINIWQSEFVRGPTVGGDWEVAGSSGSATICTGGGCESLKRTRIQVHESERGKRIKGRVESETTDGFKIAPQDFEAIWCQSQDTCG